MECQRRRGRRGRGHSYASVAMPNHPYMAQQGSRQWQYTSSLTSLLIMTSLIGIIYLMLDFHCTTCSTRCDMSNLTKSIEQMSKSLASMKDSYYDLDMKIAHYYQEIPKMEGQIDILEALANTIEQKELAWNPKTQMTLPSNVEYHKDTGHEEAKNSNTEYLKESFHEKAKNIGDTEVSKRLIKLNTPEPVAVNED